MDQPCHQKQIFLLPQGNTLLSLMTILRDKNTSSTRFAEITEKVGDRLISAALDILPSENFNVVSPTGTVYEGVRPTANVCGVSILRAGASLENSLRRGYTGPLSFGKILIQRDETTGLPTLFYSKFPSSIASKTILILEPMLATGGSASAAIDVIKAQGVPEENIIFVNIVASQQGIKNLFERFPFIRLVTAAVDKELTTNYIISPGLGDFGDRFYGTCD
ncbi:hypothetical protein ASPWEDRAFT_141540 [Aspergillus wentii DTO 134E9]|uniref:uracil phosphoribosyltransferase n=1 Tax=Aspergillus wentii DTO 134E9 TaxID=1073089 RepID=A0A1L9R8V2_ASPWE|nr:uncharacterized protein ASPWEDRAFT_141540 [Aspergillus wentii DTO 134E9]KAI9926604.1 hypothetical protein MW887_004373 [Aspergillus wentii]OJJ31346.1 hypothetical protein ASPWEDRAFT_141540 [Aspergillus wentii DTO 134E9]